MPNQVEKESLITNQDLEKIYKAAEMWREKLSNKAVVLFYEEKKNKIECETICFKDENFSHLIGCDRNRKNGVTALEFYNKAIEHNLKPWDDFAFSNYKLDGRVNFDLKMEVISQIFNISYKPLQIGNFNEMMFVDLAADRVVGHKNASLAVELEDMNYFPKSVLNRDFRTCVYTQTIAPVMLTAQYELDNCKTFEITRLSKAIDTKRAQQVLQAVWDFYDEGKNAHLFESLEANGKIDELAKINNRELAKKILENMAKAREWDIYDIVEDTYAFENGLTVIGYESEAAKAGYEEDGELGCERLDVDALARGEVIFYDENFKDNIVSQDLKEYLQVYYHLDNLTDVKTQDFIDAQGLSDDLHAPQHVDAEFAKPVLNFKDIKTADKEYSKEQQVEDDFAPSSSYECLENKKPNFTSEEAKEIFEKSIKNNESKKSKFRIKPPNELRSYATQKAAELNSGKEKPAQAKSQGLKI